MTVVEMIKNKVDTILLKAGSYEQARQVFVYFDEEDRYYFTGTFLYAVGYGIIPPCDIEIYKAKGAEITECDKWVRRGVFAN